MLKTINNKIQRGFSGSARQYDRFSGLHREIADKLLAQVVKEPAPSVLLDVGCGTGYLTGMLKDHFSHSQIIGIDFAEGMLDEARLKHDGVSWILADGNNLPFSDGSFDMVVSNLAYQWAGDLTQAFSEARRVLSANGVLACTLFGYHTCQELFQALQEAQAKGGQFIRLPDESQVRESLVMSGLNDSKVSTEQIKLEFKDMHELLAWLKSIGANNISHEGYLGRGTINKAASIYREQFPFLQGVGATFEVIRVYGKK